ncbi:MAG TPA: TetR/AcrR family transcriptional regulator [Spirillospora sp.]|nr:TetR/AcrR family transcriptional regulator [Spirillospora sp.]
MSFSRDFEHREALFNAALAEFIDKGYERASINTILQAAGMSKGQFYYHFENKQALYLALIGVLLDKKRAFLQQALRPEELQQDIFSIFKAQMRCGVAFARAYPAINRFSESFIREGKMGSTIYKKALELYNFEDNDAIEQLIEMAYQRGDFRPDLPLPFIKRVIGHLFTHAAEIVDLNRADAYEDELDHLIEFIRSGLGKQN